MNARIQAVLDHGQYILGRESVELEERLAAYVGAKHCIGASSGTDTLLIALMAYGIGPGHEVITSPFTFIATGEMIALAGATPVFVDIDARTYNMDPALIERAITPRTKAIMPVSLYGQCADMDAINAIARRHRLPVIEDGAQSFGARYHGKRSCGLSEVGSTSFFPAKPLGCYGDGGALFTNDDDLSESMRAIRTHGGVKRNHHPILGMNGRLDTLQADVLLAKLPHLPEALEDRARIAERCTRCLRGICRVPEIAEGNSHVYAQYTIRVPHRDQLASALKEEGIPTAVYYPKCLHEQPVFEVLGYKWGDFPVSEQSSR